MERWSSKLAINRTKESHLQATNVIKLVMKDLTVGHIVHRLTQILHPGNILLFTNASNNPVVSTFYHRGLE
jgi:hypothetical protein